MSEESHEVTVEQAQDWLERHGLPSEMALKYELKGLFPEAASVRRAKASQ